MDDDAISDGGEDVLTPEQHGAFKFEAGHDCFTYTGHAIAQLESGLEHVRAVIGSEEDSGLADGVVRDALWDQYFDVENAIGWLLGLFQIHSLLK